MYKRVVAMLVAGAVVSVGGSVLVGGSPAERTTDPVMSVMDADGGVSPALLSGVADLREQAATLDTAAILLAEDARGPLSASSDLQQSAASLISQLHAVAGEFDQSTSPSAPSRASALRAAAERLAVSLAGSDTVEVLAAVAAASALAEDVGVHVEETVAAEQAYTASAVTDTTVSVRTKTPPGQVKKGSPTTTVPPSTTAPPSTTVPPTTVPPTTAPPTTAVPPTTLPAPPNSVKPLRPGTSWQWQIDGETINETVLDGVANTQKMYAIDLFETPAATISRLKSKGIVVVCYVMTGASESYRPDASSFPASVLGKSVGGYPQERYLDIRQVDTLLPIMTARLDLAKSKGCDGIEPDLDDIFLESSGFPLTMADQLKYNRAVADAAHARGMSIGLKNGATGGVFEKAMSEFTDWALNEECNRWNECAGYEIFIAQGKAVFQVEFSKSGATLASFCPKDNARNFDGLLKYSSDTLAALPRAACRFE
jgi:hypothetical protein